MRLVPHEIQCGFQDKSSGTWENQRLLASVGNNFEKLQKTQKEDEAKYYSEVDVQSPQLVLVVLHVSPAGRSCCCCGRERWVHQLIHIGLQVQLSCGIHNLVIRHETKATSRQTQNCSWRTQPGASELVRIQLKLRLHSTLQSWIKILRHRHTGWSVTGNPSSYYEKTWQRKLLQIANIQGNIWQCLMKTHNLTCQRKACVYGFKVAARQRWRKTEDSWTSTWMNAVVAERPLSSCQCFLTGMESIFKTKSNVWVRTWERPVWFRMILSTHSHCQTTVFCLQDQ